MTKVKKPTATGKARKKQQAITALLEAPTIREAAEACGVSVRTLQRWLAESSFSEEYRRAKVSLLSAAAGRLSAATGLATSVLMHIAADQHSPSAARVTAARAIIEHAQRDREQDDLAVRISKLESIREEA